MRAKALNAAGELAFAQGDYVGVDLQPADQAEADRYAAIAREQLDEVTFESAWADGRAMSLEQAVAYALGEDGR
jgi:hypothetical protein